jgi:hypothetical protein
MHAERACYIDANHRGQETKGQIGLAFPRKFLMLKPLFALALVVTVAHAAPPVVQLSDDHQQMSTVKVGDAWPALALKTTAGAEVTWADQQGAKATVVGVTTGNGWMSKGLRKDLAADIAVPLADQGVKAVAITVAPAGAATEGLTTLADADGAAFAKLGKGRLPRVYVLDSAGKIVWFDLEYTNSTRRELKATLDELLAK